MVTSAPDQAHEQARAVRAAAQHAAAMLTRPASATHHRRPARPLPPPQVRAFKTLLGIETLPTSKEEALATNAAFTALLLDTARRVQQEVGACRCRIDGWAGRRSLPPALHGFEKTTPTHLGGQAGGTCRPSDGPDNQRRRLARLASLPPAVRTRC